MDLGLWYSDPMALAHIVRIPMVPVAVGLLVVGLLVTMAIFRRKHSN